MNKGLKRGLARGIYRVAVCLALPLAFGYFFWRGRREPAYRRRWRERLGYGNAVSGQPCWIHAASVGEVVLAEPLVRALHARDPQRPIVVTTFTPTGAERVREKLGDIVSHRYLPLDTAAATRRFMHCVSPCCGVIIETELWPNLLHAAARAEVPVLLANASISERSAKRYVSPLLAPLMHATIADIGVICAASSIHAQRFRTIGATTGQVVITGNLKYDITPDPEAQEQGAELRKQWQAENRPIWVAASTHEGEETLVLAAHRALQATCPNVLLVLAPRHPQCFPAVAELLQAQGWHYASHADGAPVNETTEVVLGNTLGDVPRFYVAADAAFVGGSLVPDIGGHNVLEAALLARPLVTGAYIAEWQEIAEKLVVAGGAEIAETSQELAQVLQPWLTNRVAACQAGRSARNAARREGGALQRTLEALEALL